MLFSYKWLKEYFDEDLPKPNDLVELLLTHSFEIEGVEQKGDDYIISIDVLPNRSHDALCHYGMANEISIITGLKLKDIKSDLSSLKLEKSQINVSVKSNVCLRYMAQEIKNVKIGPSPKELSEKMEAIDQRSINNIVDITNLVMFELNQPMHAFDFDKLDGDITVRMAKDGEHLTTLDNQEVDLTSGYLLIADSKDPLALAGVKGGKKAEVDENTVNIVLESANFDPVTTRKTSHKTAIKTESSKRYENGITPELTDKAINRAVELVLKYAADENTVVCERIDEYKKPVKQTEIKLSTQKVNSVLGVQLSGDKISEILDALKFEYKKEADSFKVKIPHERLDLKIEVDLVEEVGRIYGYDNIPDQEITDLNFKATPNPEYITNALIRKILIESGFSEVITYSFVENGVVALEKPLAEDKKNLRTNLENGLIKAAELNQKNADWLGLEHVKIFEIGKVFDGKPNGYYEKMSLGLAVVNKQGIKKPKAGTLIKEVIDKISKELDVKINLKIDEDQDSFVEIDLDDVYKQIVLEKVSKNDWTDFPQAKNESYTSLSQFPFVLRDIAVWLPNETKPEELISVIEGNSGELLVRKPKQFDVYQKDDKTSYAYRLVFQSHEKTLTDEEVNKIMDKISLEIESKGWVIR